MEAKVISFGIQKGGVGKTTTTCITSFILSRDYKVLAIDMDSQGNLTDILTRRDIYQFEDKTVLDAINDEDASPYIVEVTPNLHVLPADDLLATMDRRMNNAADRFLKVIAKLRNNYDFILIDCPPNLGSQTTISLLACDYSLILLQSEPLCFKALDRYLKLLETVKLNGNPKLNVLGILTTMLDSRAALDSTIIEQAREDYEEWVFNVTIKRRAKLKEFTITGISDATSEDRKALQLYEEFVKEMLIRCEQAQPV